MRGNGARVGQAIVLGAVLMAGVAAAEQAKAADPYGGSQHGVLVREAVVYISPDTTSARLATASRGREVAILETTQGWLHVLASVTRERDVTGWMLDKGVIRKSTPKGDQIMYGEAVNSEAEASKRRGRRGAAEDAQRLYARTVEYFPQSPLAGEAAYRAADVEWQLEREAYMSRPSAKQRDPNMRAQMNEERMREVIKKYPHSKWADLAAYNLIDNKLCGDWEGESKCPEKEAEIYEKYAAEHPQSPRTPEALYNAAWRQAALIQIYKMEGKGDRPAKAKNQALALAQRIIGQYAQSDWAPRAQSLAYLVENDIPTYGSGSE